MAVWRVHKGDMVEGEPTEVSCDVKGCVCLNSII